MLQWQKGDVLESGRQEGLKNLWTQVREGSIPSIPTKTDLLHFSPRPRLRLGLRRAENKGNSRAF